MANVEDAAGTAPQARSLPASAPMQLVLWHRSHEALCEAAVTLCLSRGQLVTRHLLASHMPSAAAIPGLFATPDKRRAVLCSKMKAMVAHSLAYGANFKLSSEYYINNAEAQSMIAAITKHYTARRAPVISVHKRPQIEIPPPLPPPPCCIC